jgi:hypothetical protein
MFLYDKLLAERELDPSGYESLRAMMSIQDVLQRAEAGDPPVNKRVRPWLGKPGGIAGGVLDRTYDTPNG